MHKRLIKNLQDIKSFWNKTNELNVAKTIAQQKQ